MVTDVLIVLVVGVVAISCPPTLHTYAPACRLPPAPYYGCVEDVRLHFCVGNLCGGLGGPREAVIKKIHRPTPASGPYLVSIRYSEPRKYYQRVYVERRSKVFFSATILVLLCNFVFPVKKNFFKSLAILGNTKFTLPTLRLPLNKILRFL